MSRDRIDLNADVGEGCGSDAALFGIVTSANVACGWHAGDEETMRATVRAALQNGVAIGAHPSYPDREHFGRRAMDRSPDQVYSDVIAQLRALGKVVREEGARLSHVKAHGALYNEAARNRRVADAVARAVRDFDSSLAVVALAGSVAVDAAREAGLRAHAEIFADRRYMPDGTLVPRGEPGATIDDAQEAVAQTLALMQRGADTICLHGDGPRALEFARAIREALTAAGISICTPQ